MKKKQKKKGKKMIKVFCFCVKQLLKSDTCFYIYFSRKKTIMFTRIKLLIFSREIHRIAIPGINVTVEINIKNITKVKTSNMKVIFKFRMGFLLRWRMGQFAL